MASTCQYYKYEGGLFSGGDYCLVSGEKSRISSDYYNRYCCRDYNMRDCPLFKKYGPYLGSNTCFITTVVCNILGKKDNDKVLETLRSFRDNFLQKNEEYYETLKEYDVIGPIIADKLYNDKDKTKLAETLYNSALIPITNLINNKEYEKAVEKYKLMTLLLVNYYGIKHEYNKEVDANYHYQEFDPKTSGHGRKRILSN